MTFAEVGVPADLAASLEQRGILHPFAIQTATIPDAIAGRDVSGKAPTGSGKTLAFGLPLVARVGKATPRRPRALILVPTRELAAQVARELTPLAATRGRSVAAFYGGAGLGPQRTRLRAGCDIVVACPGRLEDLLGTGDASLADVDLVVIDEADRMADMGFLPAVTRLLDQVRSDRQTLLFSATLDRDVDGLVARYQRDPARHVSDPDAADGTEVTHVFWSIEQSERVALTADIVRRTGPTIVFCRTRRGADRVASQLRRAGVGAAAIHGGRTQAQRDQALRSFTHGASTPALVATDVAARGIHVDRVACVVHFDPAGDAKDYVHRSGRTGRAGAAGTVVSLVTPGAHKAVRTLQRDLERPEPIEAPGPDRLAGLDTLVERPAATHDHPPARSPIPRRHPRDGRMLGRRRDAGTVKSFHPTRGYGFIARRGAADVFVHASGLDPRLRTLEAGQRVRFEVAPGRRGQQAVNVRPV